MSWIVAKMKWIMLVSGALTCTMVYALIAPAAALQSTFGATLEGPAADLVVRNWVAVVIDLTMVLLFAAYLIAVRRGR